MLKSCSYCGKIHTTTYICEAKPTYRPKSPTVATRVHNSYKWNKTREIARRRDAYMCAYCLKMKLINYVDVEVHHITSIVEDESRAFDLSNLITLCRKHHEMAEQGLISKQELYNIVNSKR